jgi:hypothetical protein
MGAYVRRARNRRFLTLISSHPTGRRLAGKGNSRQLADLAGSACPFGPVPLDLGVSRHLETHRSPEERVNNPQWREKVFLMEIRALPALLRSAARSSHSSKSCLKVSLNGA